jgi:hypothetical protein
VICKIKKVGVLKRKIKIHVPRQEKLKLDIPTLQFFSRTCPCLHCMLSNLIRGVTLQILCVFFSFYYNKYSTNLYVL